MNTSRRDFIAGTGHLLLGASLSGTGLAAVQGQDTPTLVTIYLRGGVDTLGVLVPYKEKLYPELRPTIAVAAPDSKKGKASLLLDDTFSLNPAMADVHRLYQAGQCVPMVCVGSHHSTRSHFDAQDFMERGAPGMRNITDGWLNRYLAETKSKDDAPLRAIALQSRLPRSLRGAYPVLAVPKKGTTAMAIDEFSKLYRIDSAMGKMSGNAMRQQINQSGHNTIAKMRYLDEIMAQSDTAEKVDYPDSNFGRQMQQIAKVIKAKRGLEIAAVDYNGWDHHVDEGPIDGNMAKHLGNVSSSIGAFAKDLGPQMNRVMVLVMSEFGRTAKEDVNLGAYHGHGGLMMAIGGLVNGKQVLGKWNGLDADQLYEKRDLPVHTDFRNVLAETLQSLFGYDGIKSGLFPEYTPATPPLKFMNQL